jgi:hypothetical protein
MFNGVKTCWVRGYHVYPERGSKCKICNKNEKENVVFGERPLLAPDSKLFVKSDDNEFGLGCPLMMIASFEASEWTKNIRFFTEIINLLAEDNCDPPTPDDLYDMIFDNDMNGNTLSEVDIERSRELRRRLSKKYGDH